MSKRLTIFAIIVLLLSIFLIYFSVQYKKFLTTPLSTTQSIHYVFEPGSSVHRLIEDLQAQGFLQHPRLFLFLAYLKGITNKLKTGEYLFAPGTTPNQLLNQMSAGNIIPNRFTIVEGWTFQQLIAALNTLPDIKHTLDKVSSLQVLANLGLPPQNPEGLFFPATYYFSLGTKDTLLLKWAYQLLQKKLNQAWHKRDKCLPYKTKYEALIAASLVEKETAVPQERSMISGVIARRLAKGMPLQIDASVIYGLGNTYSGKLTIEDLRRDTPYNTYTRKGLPPTPIAMPSLKSIIATLHPDHSQNLYYVAKGNGSHQFSINLAEHNLAVQSYQLDKRYPNIKKKNKTGPILWYASKNIRALFNHLNEVGSY
jgi:UPF0755 protein